jgi:hypothetical protein
MKVYELMSILAKCDPNAEVVVPCAPYGGPAVLHKINTKMLITDYDENPELEGIYVGLGYGEAEHIHDDDLLDETPAHTVVFIRKDCPDGYWYSGQRGTGKFNVERCNYSDMRDVEGFGHKEPGECWKVANGEFSNNLIDKAHCSDKEDRIEWFDDIIPDKPEDFIKFLDEE